MSTGGQITKRRRNIAETFNRLSKVHECYRQTTDGRTTTYSERGSRSLIKLLLNLVSLVIIEDNFD